MMSKALTKKDAEAIGRIMRGYTTGVGAYQRSVSAELRERFGDNVAREITQRYIRGLDLSEGRVVGR